jgi:hypothetical protein
MKLTEIQELYKLLESYLMELNVTANFEHNKKLPTYPKIKAVETLLKDFECIRVINGEEYGDYR